MQPMTCTQLQLPGEFSVLSEPSFDVPPLLSKVHPLEYCGYDILYVS